MSTPNASQTSYGYIIDTGTIVEDTATLLTDVQGEFTAALGPNLDTDSSTPQGSLITAEVIARAKVMKNNADLANVFNPNLSYGVFLDAICALLGVERGSNQSTIVTGVLLTGENTTQITAGSRVQTQLGDVFVLADDVTIPAGGSIRATFLSQVFGPIPAAIGTLSILDGAIGWGSAVIDVNSSVAEGTVSLSNSKLKNVRRGRLAAQGTGSSLAIKSRVDAVANVKSSRVVENNTGAAGLVNGITFTLPNAMWVCVGGNPDPQLVANALYAAHSGGCPWDYGTANGTPIQSPNGVSVIDPATGLPYTVKACISVKYDVYVKVTVAQGNSSADTVVAVQNAMVQYANGEEELEEGLVVGTSVSSFELAGAAIRQLPGIYIKSCTVACVLKGNAPPAPGDYTNEFVMPLWGEGVLQTGNINVTTF